MTLGEIETMDVLRLHLRFYEVQVRSMKRLHTAEPTIANYEKLVQARLLETAAHGRLEGEEMMEAVRGIGAEEA